MVNKKIIIRVDGNFKIGLGHIYRGLALAEMLKDEYLIEFVTRFDTTISPLQNSGFDYIFIPEAIKFKDESNWFKENYSKRTIIVLDGYDFNQEYQQKIKDLNYKLVYIDDLSKGIQKADIVINHSPGVKPSDYKADQHVKFALGTKYALLRPTFLEAAKEERIIDKIDTALVCFGGSDVYDITLTVTKALLKIKRFEKINIIIGASYPHNEIFQLSKENSKIEVYQNLSENDLIKVMQKSNFAIAPASTILYELCCIKMPILSGFYVENQRNIFQGLQEKKVIFSCNDMTKMSENDFENKILECFKKGFHDQLDNQTKLFSGGNKKRLINLIRLLIIKFRNVEEKDLNLFYEWVNDTDVRNNAINPRKIKFEEHSDWFKKIIKSKTSKIYVVEDQKGTPIGQIRFDFKDEEFVIDYSIDSNFRGKGYGKFIVEYGVQKLIAQLNKPIIRITASVKKQNIASLKVFNSLGFNILNRNNGLVNFNKLYTEKR